MSRKPLIFVTFSLGLVLSLIALGLTLYGGFVSESLGWLQLLGLLCMNVVGGAIGLLAIRLEIQDYHVSKFIAYYVYCALLFLAVLLFLAPIGLGIYAFVATSFAAIQIAITLVAWIQGGLVLAVLSQLH